MRLLSIIIGCVFLLAADQKKYPPRKIIDVHFHAFKYRDAGDKPPPNPVTGKVYGSDQMFWEDAIPLSIKNVENAPFLTEAQKQDIFYNNAAKFYNIK